MDDLLPKVRFTFNWPLEKASSWYKESHNKEEQPKSKESNERKPRAEVFDRRDCTQQRVG